MLCSTWCKRSPTSLTHRNLHRKNHFRLFLTYVWILALFNFFAIYHISIYYHFIKFGVANVIVFVWENIFLYKLLTCVKNIKSITWSFTLFESGWRIDGPEYTWLMVVIRIGLFPMSLGHGVQYSNQQGKNLIICCICFKVV